MYKKNLVLKFGGNTLSNRAKILNAIKIIAKRKKQGYKVLVVASANGNITDILLDSAYALSDNPHKRELDMLLTTGERISTALLAIALRENGFNAISLTGSQVGIMTTKQHAGADILKLTRDRLKKEMKKNNIPIIAGFQGIGEHNEITTLKRGGSDVSAVFLANEIKATLVEMIKDVDGVYNQDPHKYRNAKKYSRLSYDDMNKLSIHGSSLLHCEAICLAKKYSIKIKITHYSDNKKGTVIG